MKTSNPVPTSVQSNPNLRYRKWLTHPKSPKSLTLPPVHTRHLFQLLVPPLKNLQGISSNHLHFSFPNQPLPSQYYVSLPTQT